MLTWLPLSNGQGGVRPTEISQVPRQSFSPTLRSGVKGAVRAQQSNFFVASLAVESNRCCNLRNFFRQLTDSSIFAWPQTPRADRIIDVVSLAGHPRVYKSERHAQVTGHVAVFVVHSLARARETQPRAALGWSHVQRWSKIPEIPTI